MKKNPAVVWLDTLQSNKTVISYTTMLNHLCRRMAENSTLQTFDWSTLDYTRVLVLRRELLEVGLIPHSINTYISTLKGVAREAWRLGIICVETYMHIKEVKPLRGRALRRGRALEPREIRKLINSKVRGGDALEVRDTAIIATIYGGGLRRSELVKLDLSDYYNGGIAVKGKGGNHDFLYLPTIAQKHLDRWLAIRGNQSGALFPPFDRGSKPVIGSRMSDRRLEEVLKLRGEQLGLDKFSPHDLRRSFATNLLDKNVDIFTVQKLMRHACIETTRIYDMRGERSKREAVELLPF